MELSYEVHFDNRSTTNQNCTLEDNSIYEECSICCESFTNKAFIDECLHPFCYQCILEWTKVKAACPLCIGPITKILHNIRSQDDYDVETVEPPRVDVLANIDNDFIFDVDDTDTESSYGGMESMEMESDYDDSVIYENDDFNDVNYDNETGNFFDQHSNHEELDQDEASAQSSAPEESEDEGEVENDEDEEEEESSSDHEDDEDEDESANRFYNVESDSDGDEEQADDEYDCDSNDAESDNDNDNNYFDNTDEEDDDNDEEEEDEPEHNFFDAEQDDDDHDSNEYDFMCGISDDDDYEEPDYEEPDVEYNPTSTSDDEYYC